MKTKYLIRSKKWTAFTTINGLDIQEYGKTEKEATQKLADRIATSDFLAQGLRMPSMR